MTRRQRAFLVGIVLVLTHVGTAASAEGRRVWEVNGIRLEEGEVERLAHDIARQTVVAVERVEGVELRSPQPELLEDIYYEVALKVYGSAVDIVTRDGIGDDVKEERVKRLVLAGQERSTVRVSEVLDAAQYSAYRAWEKRQVEAFRRRGLWSSRRRARGGRRR